jgi:hypothetical protein
MFQGMTPWGPIIFVTVVVVGGAVVVLRVTGRSGYTWTYALLVVGLALAAFGTIATAMFVPAGMLLISAVVVFIATARVRHGLASHGQDDNTGTLRSPQR